MNRFINILQFFTRIKIGEAKYDPHLGDGIIYLPLVGAIIGAVITFAGFLANLILKGEFPVITSIIILLSEVIITGGLHIDGFGDTFDGIFSYRSKSRILEIMRDPRLGTNGILSIVFLILIKTAVLYALVSDRMFWPIFLMPIIGRFTCVILSYKTVPARENGMGNIFIGKCDIGTLIYCTGITSLAVVIISLVFSRNIIIPVLSLLSVLLIYVFSALFEIGIYKKIGGLTGDTLGCGIELGELIFIIYILIITGILK